MGDLVIKPDAAFCCFPRCYDVRLKYVSLLGLWKRFPELKGRRGALREMSHYQCAPTGKHFARLACGFVCPSGYITKVV
jgi:hypothetical protein